MLKKLDGQQLISYLLPQWKCPWEVGVITAYETRAVVRIPLQ